MAANTITTTPVLYRTDIISKEATVIADSSLAAKAGHLLFMDITNGKYKAKAATTSLIPTGSGAVTDNFTGPVAVLLEDAALSTSDTTCKVIAFGTVYYEMVRAAGIDETKCPDWLLDKFSALQSGVRFIGKEE